MNATKPEYSGPERRNRRIYVTQNHEYHCKAGICVAVRDTETGKFVPKHLAIGKTMIGALVLAAGGGIRSIALPKDATPGQRVHFSADPEDRNDLITSSLKSIERPSRETVAQYDGILG